MTAQTSIPVPAGNYYGELYLWRCAMGDMARNPETVPVGLSVQVGNLTIKCSGERVPTGLTAVVKRLASGKRETKSKRKAPKGVALAALAPERGWGAGGYGQDARDRAQVAAYHRAMETGRWAA